MVTAKENLRGIVAMTFDRVIGSNNTLPWRRMPSDMRRFRERTLGRTMVMGWSTFSSIIERSGKPLHGRENLVLTHHHAEEVRRTGATPITSIEDALLVSDYRRVYVIGGQQIYETFLPHISLLEVTLVYAHLGGDRYFPEIKGGQWAITAQSEPAFHDPRDEYASNFIFYRRIAEA